MCCVTHTYVKKKKTNIWCWSVIKRHFFRVDDEDKHLQILCDDNAAEKMSDLLFVYQQRPLPPHPLHSLIILFFLRNNDVILEKDK